MYIKVGGDHDAKGRSLKGGWGSIYDRRRIMQERKELAEDNGSE